MSSVTSQLLDKLNSSNLSEELKEVLGFFVDILQNSSNDKKVQELEDRVVTLEAEVQQLRDSIDDNNQYERKDTIVLSGEAIPKEEEGENCKAKLINSINDTLGLETPLIDRDINICHRVGKKPNPPGPRPRAIYVKLCRRDVIPEIYAKCRQVRPDNFFVSDSQTPLRSKISYMLRQLKKKDPSKIAAVVTSRGDPVALIPLLRSSQRQRSSAENPAKVPTKRVTITTKLQLDYFVRDHFQTTLQELNLPWNQSA